MIERGEEIVKNAENTINPENKAITGGRGSNGQFVKGQSGNPGGRPSQPEEVKEILRGATVPAVQLLIETMNSPNAKPDLRVRCAEILLDRTLGKAVQPLTNEVSLSTFDWSDISTDELRRLAELEEDDDSQRSEE